jgi:ribosomal protein L22
MSPDEITPEEEPKPKPRRRRRKKAAASDAPEVTSTSEVTASEPSEAEASDTPEPEPLEEAEEPIAAETAEEPKPASEPVAARPPAPSPPARSAPARRRASRDPNLPAPVVRAQAKYVRSSARKARLVCDHIRGKSVEEARAILALTPRAIASDWTKLLESAVANAEHNHELVGEDLYVKAVHADEGPTIKRFRPRALGRATRIRKRTSHLTILLTPRK